jgi:hypothetical protein
MLNGNSYYSGIVKLYFIFSTESARRQANSIDPDQNPPENPVVPDYNIVRGVFFREIHHATIYQRSIPVSFVIDLPPIEPFNSTTSTCSAEVFICSLYNESDKMHQLFYKELLHDHPYLKNGIGSRSSRGLIDGVGWFYKELFGVATTQDINQLHVTTNFIKNRQSSIESTVTGAQRYVSDVVKNLTSWSYELKESFEQKLNIIRHDLLAAATTSYEGEAALAHVATNILKTQYYEHISRKIENAADSCR